MHTISRGIRSRWTAALRSVRFASAPAIATPSAMARTAGLLYVSASALCLIALCFHQEPGVRWAESITLGSIGLSVGAGLIVAGRRCPRWAYHLLIVNGNLLIGLAIWTAGGGVTSLAVAVLFVFASVNCFFFFAWPWAVLHVSFAVVSCVVSLVMVRDAGFGQVLILPGTFVVVAAVVGWLVRAADAAELDPLTGLLNRRGLERHLTEALAGAEQGAHTVSFALLDVDHFKAVNDAEGHAGGDRLLRQVGQAWSSLLADGDVLARFGGDEFALIVIDGGRGGATRRADRLRRGIPDGHTCSAGVAEWEPGDTVSLLTARADAALYDAKRGGRNRVVHHDGHRDDEAAAILQAIENGEFMPYYQPVVDLATGVVTGVEVLARWFKPGHGMVPPDDFIPRAEATGVIVVLGRKMLDSAVRQVRAWSLAEGRPLVASVNVSGRELRDPGYVQQVTAILADAGLPPSQLVLELTETAIEGDPGQVIAALEALHRMGVTVAIDDFGTGYSSLSRLDRLPVDIVKIDRSFVSYLPPGASHAPLIAAITAMAGALGLLVVAEGIENGYQASLMAQLGCERGQGYWFARPSRADDVDLSPRAIEVRHPCDTAQLGMPLGVPDGDRAARLAAG